MNVVCAWCHGVIGRKPGPEDAVTHGICPECREGLEASLRDASGAAFAAAVPEGRP